MVPEGWSTSKFRDWRCFRSRFVPDAGVVFPEFTPSCEKGFVEPDAGVILILARLTSGSLAFASAGTGVADGVEGCVEAVEEASPPSGFGCTGFDCPSFARRRCRIYITPKSAHWWSRRLRVPRCLGVVNQPYLLHLLLIRCIRHARRLVVRIHDNAPLAEKWQCCG